MRNISCSLTEKQVRDGSKDVTRRLGWEYLKSGDHLMFCRKVMGRKKGEPLVKIREIEVVSVKRERLSNLTDWPAYGRKECIREGFPQMLPSQFVAFFCESHKARTPKHPKGCTPETVVTRIEFRYVTPTRPDVHSLPLGRVYE